MAPPGLRARAPIILLALVFRFVAFSPEGGTTPYRPRHGELTHTFGGNRLGLSPRSGDTPVIRIQDLSRARAYASSSAFPNFGALTASLQLPFPEKVLFYEIACNRAVA